VTIPIYPTVPVSEVGYINSNSDAKIYIAEEKTAVQKGLETLEKCPDLKKIVVIDTQGVDMGSDLLMTFKDLKRLGKELDTKEPGLFEKLTDAVQIEDLATFVYTSGTTGHPKGAMITHKNILAIFDALDKVVPAYATDETVPFLPLCHVFERVAGHLYGMKVGITSHYAQDFNTIVEDIQTKKPTIILAVPRVCEKVYAKIQAQVKEQPKPMQAIFKWASSVGAQVSKLKEKKQPIPMLLDLQYRIAFQLVFKKISQALGGRVRWMTASGAPLSRDIADFFNAAGIFVIEGYGMTECSAPATLNTINDYRFGTTGKPIPCNKIKIAEDGEILIKGDNVIQGYWKMPEQTKETFTEDGWLKSGDIGHLDADGFLVITDRKKDLIITAGGKNIAPQNIENMFKQDPLLEQVMVIGDNRKYLVALFNLNHEESACIAKQADIPFEKPEDLFEKEEFRKIIDQHVEELNKNLARVETIKYYRILKNTFSEQTGELTPSLKVKRKVVMNRYKAIIESMYPPEEA
jgi:long-chain acyl-CoA synthetase